MPSGPEIHIVTHTNAVADLLKIVLPGLIAVAGALIGVWLGGRNAAQTARRTREWDAKRDGYLRLFAAAHELAFQAGLVMMAVNRRAAEDLVEAERQKFRSAFATLNAAAVVSRVTASAEGQSAVSNLVGYLRDELNPFLQEGVPDPLTWMNRREPDLTAKLNLLEEAATADLATEPFFGARWPPFVGRKVKRT